MKIENISKNAESEILNIGKVDSDILKNIVFDKIQYKNQDVIIRPSIGEDCAVMKSEEKYIIMSTDPITASIKDIGKVAIHITCNDIASNGVKPVGIMLAIMLPFGTTKMDLENIMDQAGAAARKLKVDIIGGHTEVTKAVNQPVIVSTAVGKAYEYEEEKVEAGDGILMTKYAGMEGTGIIAGDFPHKVDKILSTDEVVSALHMMDEISVVEEGILIGEIGFCKMHDITEGGILGAVWETCSLIDYGCVIEEEKIPVMEVTKKISKLFNIDYLRLISSGSMLVIVKKQKIDKVIERLGSKGILCTQIGEITHKAKGINLKNKNGILEKIAPPQKDEIYKAI